MEETSFTDWLSGKINNIFDKHCHYCNQTGHNQDNCNLYKTHIILKSSNIPTIYWNSPDPYMSFLMNQRINEYNRRKIYDNDKLLNSNIKKTEIYEKPSLYRTY